MLGQHPQLYALPETQLLVRDTMDEWIREFGSGIHSHGLLRAIAEIVFGGQTEFHVNLALQWLEQRRNAATGAVLSELIDEIRPLRLVEKTPMLTYRLEHMERAAWLFPDAFFLHLTRHPAGYGTSLLEFFRHRAPIASPSRLAAILANRESIFYRMYDPTADSPGFDPQHAWRLRHREVATFTASINPRRTLLIRAEDLLVDPRPCLSAVCEWLGVDSSSGAIDEMLHPENSPFGRFGPPRARFGADPKFLARPALRMRRERLPSLEEPMPWSTAGEGFSPPVRQLAASLGYG
jgi:Sulfotransferase family